MKPATITTCILVLLSLNNCTRSKEVIKTPKEEKAVASRHSSARIITFNDTISSYDNAVLADQPVAFWNTASGIDFTGNGHTGSAVNNPAVTSLPDGGTSPAFNGTNQYIEVSSTSDLSVPATGILTLEAWIRPDTLDFTGAEGTGYVNLMGKGTTNAYEYVARMYGRHPGGSDAGRGNRIVGQVYNLSGGSGAGSYYQPASGWPVHAGEWIHYVFVINTTATSTQYPTGYVKLYVHRKDSTGSIVSFEDQDALADYDIVPGAGNAPFRIATRDLRSWFRGAIGKVAVYNYELSAANVLAHTKKMFGYDSFVLSDQPVAFWNTASGSDLTGNGHTGIMVNWPASALLPDSGTSRVFNGINQYMEVSSAADLSVTATGILTLEAWMRPDALDFTATEGTGYVHWMGKGESSNHEYAARMYGQHPGGSDSARINRISGYVFNSAGGLGAGSYYQPLASSPVQAGEWIHYILIINTRATSTQYPTGYTKLYVHRVNSDGGITTYTDQDALIDYNIVPVPGNAPLRIGTKNLSSWFRGAVGKVAVYNYELSAAQSLVHAKKMFLAGG